MRIDRIDYRTRVISLRDPFIQSIIRIFSAGSIRSLLERATLSRFFPSLTRKSFDGLMDSMGIKDEEGKKEYGE